MDHRRQYPQAYGESSPAVQATYLRRPRETEPVESNNAHYAHPRYDSLNSGEGPKKKEITYTVEAYSVPSTAQSTGSTVTRRNINAINKPSTPDRTLQGGWLGHILASGYSIRWFKSPRMYKESTVDNPSSATVRHRDFLGRERNVEDTLHDRYLSPNDGHLAHLIVQCVDDIYNSTDQTKNATWRRTCIRNVGPKILRIACWAYNQAKPFRELDGAEKVVFTFRYILSAAVLAVALNPAWKLFGRHVYYRCQWYPVFPVKYINYSKVSKSICDDEKYTYPNISALSNSVRPVMESSTVNPEASYERSLRPRFLYVLKSSGGFHIAKYVRDRERSTSSPASAGYSEEIDVEVPPYLFISCVHRHFANDPDFLRREAIRLCKKEGLSAFWTSLDCLDANNIQKDVHRISDIVRGASKVAIVLPDVNNPALLQEWGRRLWTFPEILLAPGQKVLLAQTLDSGRATETKLKTEIPELAWLGPSSPQDAPIARQLIDHYAGSLRLSRLELVVLALKCLERREQGENMFPGDTAYILMGLLRRRPRIDTTDSAFQAFARLSLANDSDHLIEREVSTLPQKTDVYGRLGSNIKGSWNITRDAFGANLWDIKPTCQVAGIGKSDTIVLSDCSIAAIRWKRFHSIDTVTRATWGRRIARFFLRFSNLVFWVAVIVIALIDTFSYGGYSGLYDFNRGTISRRHTSVNPVSVPIIIFMLIPGLIFVLAGPYLVKILYGGKVWSRYPHFMGFEGYMDIRTIEHHIFGNYEKRLQWSANGSTLSRHWRNDYGEQIGIDPTLDNETRELVQRATRAPYGEKKVFTLVDTGNMTVTIFEAVRPPVSILVTGKEGGKLRACLCSYQWRTNTLHKETVLRMPMRTKTYMEKANSVNFAFSRDEVV